MSWVCTVDELEAALGPIRSTDSAALTRLACWTEQLERWSRVQRLVGWTCASDLLSEGIADAWAAVGLVEQCSGPILDLGSGSGLPGLVIASALPERSFHLVESRRKRASFLREAARAMGLASVTVHHCRSEALLAQPTRPRPGLVMARAFAAPPEVLRHAESWAASRCLLSSSGPVDATGGWRVETWCEGRPPGSRRHTLLAAIPA